MPEPPIPQPLRAVPWLPVSAKSRIGNLKQLRKAAHLTQIQVATKIGVEQSMYSKWERGQTMPDTRFIKGLTVALGCQFADLQIVDSTDSLDSATISAASVGLTKPDLGSVHGKTTVTNRRTGGGHAASASIIRERSLENALRFTLQKLDRSLHEWKGIRRLVNAALNAKPARKAARKTS